MHVVTMLPRNTKLWGRAFEASRAAITADEPVTVFKAVYPELDPDNPPEPQAPTKEWIGRSFEMTYQWEEEGERVLEGEPERHDLQLRLVVVESSTLRDQRAASAAGRKAKEREKLRARASR